MEKKKKVAKNPTKKKKKTGRPTKINETAKSIALNLYRRGKTDKEVAEICGVSERTINNWKKVEPEFFHSIKEAKAHSDEEVVNALYQRAIGYEHPEAIHKVVSDGMNMGSHVEAIQTTKKYPPDIEAIKFWLKNRNPDQWKDKQSVEVSDGDLAKGIEDARNRSKKS